MKMQALFDLLQDAQDVLTFFENATTTEQMISRLERMKRQAPDEFLECVDSLRFSISAALEDNLELGGPLAEEDDEADDIFDSLVNNESPASEPGDGQPGEARQEQPPATPIPAPPDDAK
jgi:hypothetical protein